MKFKISRPALHFLQTIALIVIMLSGGLPSGHVTQAQAARSGTLRVGWTPPIKLDPAFFADAPDGSIGMAVYDRLLTTDQQGNLVPGLAASYKISEDGKTVTMMLRNNVKFHDGSAFSADDVKFTIDRLLDPNLGSSARSLLADVDKVEVVDPVTVKFTLKNASPAFLLNLTDYHMFILKNGTKDPSKEFNGTGPFKTTADQVDLTTRATFTANENYWQPGLPKVAKLEMVFNKDIAALVQALKGGQLDFVARVPIELYTDLQKDPNITSVNVPTNLFPNIRLRADRKPGSDPKVRQAFRLAIDRDALNQTLYNGLAAPGYDSPVGPYFKALFTQPTAFPARDVAKAKQLLADAGYPDGLTIDLYAPQGEFNSDDLAQALQQQLKDAGITVNLHLVESGKYYSDKDPNNWLDADFAITGWSTRPDPQAYFALMFRSDGVWNEAHWNDPELDKLIDAAGKELDMAKRKAIFASIQDIMIDRGPSFIPFFRPLLVGQSSKVTGIDVAGDPGLTNFAGASIAQ
jgi:peptide/nickel transport system substrate-binding protein